MTDDDRLWMPRPGHVEARTILHERLKEANKSGDQAAYQKALAAMKRLMEEPMIEVKVLPIDPSLGLPVYDR